ncbi:MAG: hypothetical protein WBC34_19105 [Thiofilum sp.]
MQETTQIFTPENIRLMIGRKVLTKDVAGLECRQIMRVSDLGTAALLSNTLKTDLSWWELDRLNNRFFDFAPDDKKAPASPIDELMDGFFSEMKRLGVNTVLNQVEATLGPINVSFSFSVDGKEHTAETVHEIFERRFGAPFRL